MQRRCMGCMMQFDEEYDVCPFCGYEVGSKAEDAIHINPGTLLHDRYLIGKVLGYGGFGVTYLGWDGKFEHKVAIKEYLPSEFSTRMPGQTCVTVFNGDKSEQFSAGLDKFVNEAKRLMKFHNEPGIVKIYDSFLENDTAYIIMEYLEGETLTERLERDGTIPEDEAVRMLIPVMESLEAVHAEGIIHRDIAPDNIFLKSDGTVKLIDFGASRYATTTHSRSLTVIVKPGYSPEEQYRSRGDQGPHTDVYAMGATLYKTITGKRPPDAMQRRAKFEGKNIDILEEPTKINKNISLNREVAILNALNVRIEDRTPDIRTFIEELNADPPAKRRAGRIKKIDILSWPLWLKILIPSVVAVLITLGVLLATGVIDYKSLFNGNIQIPDGMAEMPNVVGEEQDAAFKILDDVEFKNVDAYKGLQYTVLESEESQYIEAGIIVYQDPISGAFVDQNYDVTIRASKGNGEIIAVKDGIATIPYVLGIKKEEAVSMLEKAGLKPTIQEVYDNVYEAGLVCSQSLDKDEQVPVGTEITVNISKGPESFEMPNVVGMQAGEASADLNGKGIRIQLSEEENSTVAEGTVLKQDVEPGTKVKKGDTVMLTVSTKLSVINVANVVGMEKSAAESKLKEQGFAVNVAENFSDDVKQGIVISQTPEAGSGLSAEDSVTIVVSKGKQTVSVPDLSKMSASEASSELAKCGLKVATKEEYSDSVEKGKVISQSVAAGDSCDIGDTVTVVISKGSQPISVPNVVGTEKKAAVAQLEKAGFKAATEEQYSADVAKGNVISQTPAANTTAVKGDTVMLTVSLGIKPVTVPNVVNTDKQSALSQLEKLGLKISTSEEYNETIANGIVISQSLSANTTAYPGDAISLVISKGKQPITVTDVVGKDAATAKSTLKKQGFTVQSTEEYNETVKQGIVISQNPAGGSTGYKGDNISIVVSKGKQPITVSNVVGKDAATAKSTLEKQGFSVKTTEEYSETVPQGNVISQSPSSGTIAYKGDNISLVVSKGQQPITVPDVVGQSRSYAKSILEGQGFVVQETTEEYSDSIATGYIVRQSPSAGSTSYKGKTVSIIISKGPQPFTVSFNANGGSVNTSSKTVYHSSTYGSLPNATRDYYSFDGWYTSSGVGSLITASSKVTLTQDQTLYAHWTLKPEQGPATSVPSGAQQTRTETQYRYRDGSWGGWSGWQNSAVYASSTRQVETSTMSQTCLTRWLVGNDDYVDSEARAKQYSNWSAEDHWVTSSSVYYYDPYKTGDHWWSTELGAEGYPMRKTGTRTVTKYRYRNLNWGNWSSWQTSAVSATSTRQVETRTVYYYRKK